MGSGRGQTRRAQGFLSKPKWPENPQVNRLGAKEWTDKHGQLHRVDGPAVEYADGGKSWWVNGRMHREDGPAVEFADGGEEWYFAGLRHREDGPAVTHADGREEWWKQGVNVTTNMHEAVEEAEEILRLDKLSRTKLDPPEKNTF